MARSFGENVEALMLQAGLARADLAAALGVKQPTLAEQLKSSNPELRTVLRYAKIFKCPVAALIDGVDPDYDTQLTTAAYLTQLHDLWPRLDQGDQLLVLNWARRLVQLPPLAPSEPSTR